MKTNPYTPVTSQETWKLGRMQIMLLSDPSTFTATTTCSTWNGGSEELEKKPTRAVIYLARMSRGVFTSMMQNGVKRRPPAAGESHPTLRLLGSDAILDVSITSCGVSELSHSFERPLFGSCFLPLSVCLQLSYSLLYFLETRLEG